MRNLHQTILIINANDQSSRKAVQAVRARNVYCEVVSPGRFVREHEEVMQGDIRGMIVAGLSPRIEEEDFKDRIQSVKQDVFYTADGQIDGEFLESFLTVSCGCTGDWTVTNYIGESKALIREQVGDKKLVCGLSGGVDSSVAAMLVHKAVGDQLTCIFVDHGFMRKDEPAMVRDMFSGEYRIPLVMVDAADRFLDKVEGVLEPETKRKLIGEEFIRIFEEEAKKVNADFLVQGTIYPDVIESGEDGKVVKSHHNVGGLPERIHFEGIIEPLRFLFKEEVRAVGRELGLPAAMVERQPFPGPGLAIRCLGGITREKLDILREADAIFREEIEEGGLRDMVSQYFAVMTGLQSVGVEDGARTYDYAIALRAVKTDDFMAALPVEFSWDFLKKVTRRITEEVPHVSRVVYELTGKPPATIEWE